MILNDYANLHTINNWLRESIMNQLDIPLSFQKKLKSQVTDFYFQNSGHLPYNFKIAYPILYADIENIVFSHFGEDSFIFHPTRNDEVSCKVFYEFYRPNCSKVAWGKDLWRHYLSLSCSFLVWRVIHATLPTDDILQHCGLIFPSHCRLCVADSKLIDHIFYSCPSVSSLWQALGKLFQVRLAIPSSFNDLFRTILFHHFST